MLYTPAALVTLVVDSVTFAKLIIPAPKMYFSFKSILFKKETVKTEIYRLCDLSKYLFYRNIYHPPVSGGI